MNPVSHLRGVECRFLSWVEPGLRNPSCGGGFDPVTTRFEVLEKWQNVARPGWTQILCSLLVLHVCVDASPPHTHTHTSVGLIHLLIDAVGIHINLHCAQVCRLAKYNIKCHKYTCYLCMSVCHIWIHRWTDQLCPELPRYFPTSTRLHSAQYRVPSSVFLSSVSFTIQPTVEDLPQCPLTVVGVVP